MPQSKAPAALTRPITGFTFGGAHEKGLRDCAVEVPVNIVHAPVPYAVMMATPRFPRRPRKWEVTKLSLINFGNFIGCEGFPWIETGRLGGAGLLRR